MENLRQTYLSSPQTYNFTWTEHCKVGLVYSQALRIIERCSKDDDKISHMANLKQKLKDRNYPEDLIDQRFQKANKFNRKDLIFKKKNPPKKMRK